MGVELILILITECCLKNPGRTKGVVQGLSVAHLLCMASIFILFLWGHIELYRNKDVGSYDN